MKTVEVVAGIVINEGQILCTQRGESKLNYISKKYEFPGGKIELNEPSETALARELKEELLMDAEVKQHFMTVKHQYADFNIILHTFICHADSRELTLTEHLDAKWLSATHLDSLDWAAADIPVVEKLKIFL